MKQGVAVGVPTYNAAREGTSRLRSLLQNLRQRTPNTLPFEILICDDSGNSDHRRRVESLCKEYDATFIWNELNSGVAASWNRLCRATDYEIVILLNDDVLMDKDWLRPFAYAIRSNPKVAAFSLNCYFITESDVPLILAGPDAKAVPLNVHWRGDRLVRDERFHSMPLPGDGSPGRVMCPGGMAFGFRREIYDMVGGFDERYKAFYEESDFGVSCAERGFPSFTLSVPPNNYHIWSATFGSAPEIDSGRLMKESKAKFVEKWSARLGVRFNDAPDIHNILMDRIPKFEVKWIGLDGRERREVL